MSEEGSCVHWRGTMHETCEAGISLVQLAGGREPGWVYRLPCREVYRENQPPSVPCEHYQEPTAEQVAEIRREVEEAMARMIAVQPLVSLLKQQHPRGGAGISKCPVCENQLNWSISDYNGHIRMKCQGENCIAFIE